MLKPKCLDQVWMGMTLGINQTMGVDISVDHAVLVICMVRSMVRSMFRSMGRSVGRCMGGDKDMGLVGDMGMRWVPGNFHLRVILGPSWFQLFWPCHIEDNLNKEISAKRPKKVKQGVEHPVRRSSDKEGRSLRLRTMLQMM